MPPLAVLVFEFDPLVHFGDAEVKLETIALAVIVAASLLVAGLIARTTPAGEPPGGPGRRDHLRPDDLLLVAFGALPGAVLGGRLGYVLIHLDYYSANPALVIDPSQGSLELTLGVVGGCLTAAYVLRLLNASVGRWAHVAAFPLLLALGVGKLVSALGGDGQGAPTDLPWATAYAGDGPWGSLAPEIASHPAQVYEGILVLLVLLLMALLVARGAFRRADGTAMLAALLLWSIVRAVVAATWRDVPVLGPLRVEQLIAMAVAAASLGILALWRSRERIAPPADVGASRAAEADAG